MPMRDSDARFLGQDVLPLLESLAPVVQPEPSIFPSNMVYPQTFTYSSQAMAEAAAARAALRTQLAETTAQVKRRLEGRQKPASAQIHRMSRNPAVEHYSADVDGQKVPYINIVRYPCVWHEGGGCEQVFPQIEWVEDRSDSPSGSPLAYPIAYDYKPRVLWDGDWCWSVTVDDRFMYHFECREDVEMVLPILAQGMAVAAGFTSHGPHSFPRNAHGPAVGLAPFSDPMPIAGELMTAEPFDFDALADAVAQRISKPAMTQEMVIRWLEAWRWQKANSPSADPRGDAYRVQQETLSEMIESQRGSKTFPGWPFDLDQPTEG
jgi:hypothetical protein